MFKKFQKFCYYHPTFSLILFPTLAEFIISIFLLFILGFALIHQHPILANIIGLLWQFSFGIFGYFIYTLIQKKNHQIKQQKEVYSIEKIYDYYPKVSYDVLEKEIKEKEINY
jgi:amino acid transporter